MGLQAATEPDHSGLHKEPWVAADEGEVVGNIRGHQDEADMHRLGQRQELRVSTLRWKGTPTANSN